MKRLFLLLLVLLGCGPASAQVIWCNVGGTQVLCPSILPPSTTPGFLALIGTLGSGNTVVGNGISGEVVDAGGPPALWAGTNGSGTSTTGELIVSAGGKTVQSSNNVAYASLENNLYMPVTLNNLASGANQASLGMWINETVLGNTCPTTGNCFFNYFVTHDTATIGDGTSGNYKGGTAWYFQELYGGTTAVGDRGVISAQFFLTAPTANTALGASYSALVAGATSPVADNGTPGNTRGQIETTNFLTTLTCTTPGNVNTCATNWSAVQTSEFDISVQAGASTDEKVGLLIVSFINDAVQGSTYDSAIAIGMSNVPGGTVGWRHGLDFGGFYGTPWPFSANAVVITCELTCGTSTSFIDMTNATFTGFYEKFANYSVDGNGNEIVNSIKALNTTGLFTANGTTALALTNLGPVGAHATVQEWFTVTDNGGNVRYVPAF